MEHEPWKTPASRSEPRVDVFVVPDLTRFSMLVDATSVLAEPTADRGAGAALAGSRVLVVHDWMVTWAGSERCLEQILQVFPDADLVVGVLAPSMRAFNSTTLRARETWLRHVPGARTHHRWFLPAEGLAFASLNTRPYDIIVSSSHAFSKMVRASGHAVHVCYCHSPPRYLWDLNSTYRRTSGALERCALAVGGPILR